MLPEDAKGQEYIDLYYRHAAEITWLLLRDAELRSATGQLLRWLLPQVRSLLEGEELAITYETSEQIESLLDQFEAEASLELQDTIRVIREDFLHGSTLELALGAKPVKRMALRFPQRE